MEQKHTNQLTYPGQQSYPRNHWYVAAFSSEVQNGSLLHRRFLDVPVVLYRTPAGEAVALYDRCPHRGLPLSMGKQVEDRIQCGYHGMEFGPDGRCTHIPSQPGARGTMSVMGFRLVEKWQWLWIWMGDQALADPDLVPDHDWLGLTRPGYTAVPFFMMEMGANYSYIHDNLLDTTHLTYVHPGILDDGEMANAKYWTKETDKIVSLGREIPGLKFRGPVAKFFRVEEGKTYNRTLVTETFVPSISIGKQSLQDAADPEAAPIEFYALNAMTPASASSTYVFHAVANSYDPHWQQADFDKGRLILSQDKVAMEAMQRRFEADGDTEERSIKSDHAGVVCRRMITALIERERGSKDINRREHAGATTDVTATA
jgi:vanillate O-demethylase monooxygenase subunit